MDLPAIRCLRFTIKIQNAMRTTLLLLLLSISVGSLCSQSSTITLEDIWRNYKYAARSVPGFNFLSDGKHYTRLE
ncbi:hypothetical protein RZS08_59045, partial [Arthrospira platensis SPKY1]|nr:hypothetical protein [Arthrospira platensis SPKY1]